MGGKGPEGAAVTEFAMKRWMAGAVALGVGGAALAGAVPFEEAVLGRHKVTILLHPFLTEEETATLRLVLTNEQALAIFVPQDAAATGGHATLALAPGEGLIREGKPVASAVALSGFADAAAADAAALAACDAARTGAEACVVALQVQPAP